MKLTPLAASILAAGFLATSALAKAPPNATGECKDGTYTEAKSKEGACSSHGGVKSWTGPEKAAASERPAGATGECKDGSYTDAASKSGACSGHKGVKEWFGAAPSPATAKEKSAPEPTTRPTSAATGGGHGKVWVNTNSKVYHCETDALYGKTKQGEYMSEADAKASGARPARGKTCS